MFFQILKTSNNVTGSTIRLTSCIGSNSYYYYNVRSNIICFFKGDANHSKINFFRQYYINESSTELSKVFTYSTEIATVNLLQESTVTPTTYIMDNEKLKLNTEKYFQVKKKTTTSTTATNLESFAITNNGNTASDLNIMFSERDELIDEKEIMSNTKTLIFFINSVITIISILIILSVTVYLILTLYKKSTDPLNYKTNENKKSNCENVNEEFSEVRFLTSDELLDFTMVTPETVSRKNLY